jgi:hypothetical protein
MDEVFSLIQASYFLRLLHVLHRAFLSESLALSKSVVPLNHEVEMVLPMKKIYP